MLYQKKDQSVGVGAGTKLGCLTWVMVCLACLSNPQATVVAWVGQEPIEAPAVRQRWQQADAQTLEHKQQILNDLIDERLLLQKALQHGVMVTQDEVDVFYKNLHTGIDDSSYTQLLAEHRTSSVEFKQQLHHFLLVRKYLQEEVYARVVVTDEEIADYLENHPELCAAQASKQKTISTDCDTSDHFDEIETMLRQRKKEQRQQELLQQLRQEVAWRVMESDLAKL